MTRELQSETVSSVDRSSSGVADERPASRLHHENVSPMSGLHHENLSTASVPMTSDDVPTAAETSLTDSPIVDGPSSVSHEDSSARLENESTDSVSIIIIIVISDLHH